MEMIMWNNKQPIYQQVKERMIMMIVEGMLPEGEALPSVRQLASDYHLNPLTISKAYQLLLDEGLVEKRRGLGMFVTPGARALALKSEQQHFLHVEWPMILQKIRRLQLNLTTLINPKND
jgi:GntR family transcriptional regulator